MSITPLNNLTNIKIQSLPEGYDFELEHIVSLINHHGFKSIFLQFPEGLQQFSVYITIFLKNNTQVNRVVVLGDPAYGACCIDDFALRTHNGDCIFHFSHSALTNINPEKKDIESVSGQCSPNFEKLGKSLSVIKKELSASDIRNKLALSSLLY